MEHMNRATARRQAMESFLAAKPPAAVLSMEPDIVESLAELLQSVSNPKAQHTAQVIDLGITLHIGRQPLHDVNKLLSRFSHDDRAEIIAYIESRTYVVHRRFLRYFKVKRYYNVRWNETYACFYTLPATRKQHS